MSVAPQRLCKLADQISLLGQIHAEEPAFHHGRYQELLLTNRQYAYARHSDQGSAVIIAVNNDEKAADITVPVPVLADEYTDLFTGLTVPVKENKITLSLEPCSGTILKSCKE